MNATTTYHCATCDLAMTTVDKYAARTTNPSLTSDSRRYLDTKYDAAMRHLYACEWAPVRFSAA